MPTLITIDSSYGGGQMLRNAVALSAVTRRPVRVVNIRGARSQPGLRPQHLMAIRAAAEMCGAELIGAEIGSREIEFRPGNIEGRADWRLDVGTAGSLTLVLQCMLPALTHISKRTDEDSQIMPPPAFCGAQHKSAPLTQVTLIGGTDVPFSPPYDYFSQVFLPALAELGPAIESRLIMRGFYPKGGGEMQLRTTPSPIRGGISWRERGEVAKIRGVAGSLGLPGHIVERMREAAVNILCASAVELPKHNNKQIEIDLEIGERGRSEGCAIVLWAECESGRRLGASALGRRGKRAEQVGEEAAKELRFELESGSAVDSYLADQLIVWLALANAPSEFTTSRVTDHLRSAAQVAEMITGVKVEIKEGEIVRVRVVPGRSAAPA